MRSRVRAKVKLIKRMEMKPIAVIGIAIALSGIIGIGFFTFLNLGNSESTFAASSTYSSIGTGTWTTNSIWSGGSAPSTAGISDDNIIINSNHEVSSGPLRVLDNATFTISNNGTLKITGDLIVQNNLTLNISGLLIITGDLITKNDGSITINGNGAIKISGKAGFNTNTLLIVNGALQVGSTISFGNNSTFRGSGVVKVGTNSGCSNWSGSGFCGIEMLPVKLLNFIAEEVDGIVKISWKTVTEENNDFFTLQRTSDKKSYTTIGIIRGGGTSKNILAYESEDRFPLEGRSYYRLSQSSYDGKSEVFPDVAVDILYGSQPSNFSIFPNPLIGNILNVSFSKPEAGLIEIVDSRENRILTQKVDSLESKVRLILNENIQPGVYMVSYKTATSNKTERLVKR